MVNLLICALGVIGLVVFEAVFFVVVLIVDVDVCVFGFRDNQIDAQRNTTHSGSGGLYTALVLTRLEAERISDHKLSSVVHSYLLFLPYEPRVLKTRSHICIYIYYEYVLSHVCI